MALSERLAIIITANSAQAVGELKRLETSAARSVGKAETSAGKFKANATRIGAGMLIVGAAVAAGMRAALDEASEAAVVGRQTEAVIRSTGGAANVTKAHLEDLAGSLSKVAAVDDELIQSGGNVLLTFKAVANQAGEGNAIFDRATAAALDMSAALGGDLQSSVLQLGKALANPVQGLTALRRAGVDFTQQQRDQVSAMVAVGDTLGAQRLIMDEVESQFGGQAEASATAMDKLSVGWGNFLETIGKPLESSGIIDWWAANWEDPMTRLGAAWDEVERGIVGAPITIEWDGETLSRMADALGIGKRGFDALKSSAEGAAGSVEELTEAIDIYLGQTFDVAEAQRAQGESGSALAEAMGSWTPNWNTQAQAMQDYVTDTAGVITAQNSQGASQAALDGTITSSIQTLRAMRETGVVTGAQFVTLRDQILGIPHGAETRVTTPGAREAHSQIWTLDAAVRGLPSYKSIQIRIAVDDAIAQVNAAVARTTAALRRAGGESSGATAAYTSGSPVLAVVPVASESGASRQVSSRQNTGGGGDIVINLDGETIARVTDRANRHYNMARTA